MFYEFKYQDPDAVTASEF